MTNYKNDGIKYTIHTQNYFDNMNDKYLFNFREKKKHNKSDLQ